MANTEALEKKIRDQGIKKVFLAEKLGITSFGLSKKINNINEFKASEIQTLCELLNITSLKEKESIFFDSKVDK
jgi:hypothetical protein